jgi:hypothetical protein
MKESLLLIIVARSSGSIVSNATGGVSVKNRMVILGGALRTFAIVSKDRTSSLSGILNMLKDLSATMQPLI